MGDPVAPSRSSNFFFQTVSYRPVTNTGLDSKFLYKKVCVTLIHNKVLSVIEHRF